MEARRKNARYRRAIPALIGAFALTLCHHDMWGASPVSVRDFRGKEIHLSTPARRIVCLLESALTGLYMLHRGHAIVGIGLNVYTPPTFSFYRLLDERIASRSLPAPGNWESVNVEHLLALKPDLVVMWSQQREPITLLERRGVPVYGVFLTGEQDIYEELRGLGTLTASEDRARELIAAAQDEKRRIEVKTASIPQDRRPTVYFMWAQGITETSCGGSTVDDLITLAGGRNICAHIMQEHVTLQMEDIVRANPDVIVLWYNERLDAEDILRDPRLRTVRAVKEKRVYELPDIFTNDLWTLKFLIAAHRLARWLHPEEFREHSLEDAQSRLLRLFYGEKGETLSSYRLSLRR